MGNVPIRSVYEQLITDISGLYEGARRTLVVSYWKIGQRIVEVEQDGAVKAEYGSGLLQKVSGDLSQKFGGATSVESLRKMRRFYLQNQKRVPGPDLSWSQHQMLLPVRDDRKRRALEKRAIKEGLGKERLRKIVREERSQDDPLSVGVNAPEGPALPPLKCPSDLRLLTFREVTGKEAALYEVPEGHVLLDCGFFVSLAISRKEAGDVTLTAKPTYVYAARVERVIDGDTLSVVLDLGFGASVREKLRLRGINTPELGAPEGEKAKRFVAGLLPAGTGVLVKSHKTDIYGRFVADIFLGDEYLNQRLLEDGLAVRMKE